MVRFVGVLSVVGVILLALPGCGPQGTGEWKWPERFNVVSSAGVGVTANVAWAAPMEKATGMSIRIVPEPSLPLRFQLMAQGRFQMLGEAPGVVADALSARKEYATADGGPFPIRVLYSGSKSESGYVVRGDSHLKSVKDIRKGTRFAEVASLGTPRDRLIALLAWAGLKEEDGVWVPVASYAASIRAVTDGRADIAFGFPTSVEMVEAEATPNSIRWLILPYKEDPEGAKRYQDLMPSSQFGVMSTGVKSAEGVPSNVSITLKYTAASTDTELVYNMARWFDEHFEAFKDNDPATKDMSMPTLMQGIEATFVPVHDGLIRYLKEKRLWTADHDARQKRNIDLLDRYVEAYKAALDRARKQGVRVDPVNDDWLRLWEVYKKEINLPQLRLFVSINE